MSKKKYIVTAATGYDGLAEGEEFEADLTEEQEQRYIERGSIKPASDAKKRKEANGDA